MTQDEVMDLWDKVAKYAPSEVRIHEFAKLVAEKEREACATLCHDEAWKYKVLAVDKQKVDLNNKAITCFDLSEKIRARGQA